jgi:hypothetical protein
MTRLGWVAVGIAALSVLVARDAKAGPPYLTDDPEPVELGHWEFYLASQGELMSAAAAGTAPHVEVNYGAAPNLQLHLILPAAFAWTRGAPAQYGPGDAELGVKFRFVQEGDRRPQVGTFPLLNPPTGSESRGLGAGAWQVFIPLWLQKSFGAWTTYGGGGVRVVSRRDGADDQTVAGWLMQRQLAGVLAVGTEVYLTVPWHDRPAQVRFDIGAILAFGVHHVIGSAGPAFGGGARGQWYLAYLLAV